MSFFIESGPDPDLVVSSRIDNPPTHVVACHGEGVGKNFYHNLKPLGDPEGVENNFVKTLQNEKLECETADEGIPDAFLKHVYESLARQERPPNCFEIYDCLQANSALLEAQPDGKGYKGKYAVAIKSILEKYPNALDTYSNTKGHTFQGYKCAIGQKSGSKRANLHQLLVAEHVYGKSVKMNGAAGSDVGICLVNHATGTGKSLLLAQSVMYVSGFPNISSKAASGQNPEQVISYLSPAITDGRKYLPGINRGVWLGGVNNAVLAKTTWNSYSLAYLTEGKGNTPAEKKNNATTKYTTEMYELIIGNLESNRDSLDMPGANVDNLVAQKGATREMLKAFEAKEVKDFFTAPSRDADEEQGDILRRLSATGNVNKDRPRLKRNNFFFFEEKNENDDKCIALESKIHGDANQTYIGSIESLLSKVNLDPSVKGESFFHTELRALTDSFVEISEIEKELLNLYATISFDHACHTGEAKIPVKNVSIFLDEVHFIFPKFKLLHSIVSNLKGKGIKVLLVFLTATWDYAKYQQGVNQLTHLNVKTDTPEVWKEPCTQGFTQCVPSSKPEHFSISYLQKMPAGNGTDLMVYSHVVGPDSNKIVTQAYDPQDVNLKKYRGPEEFTYKQDYGVHFITSKWEKGANEGKQSKMQKSGKSELSCVETGSLSIHCILKHVEMIVLNFEHDIVKKRSNNVVNGYGKHVVLYAAVDKDTIQKEVLKLKTLQGQDSWGPPTKLTSSVEVSSATDSVTYMFLDIKTKLNAYLKDTEYGDGNGESPSGCMVLFIEKSIMTGVDMRGIKSLHFLCKPDKPAEFKQLYGRVNRNCAHSGFDYDDRVASIHMYNFTPEKFIVQDAEEEEKLEKYCFDYDSDEHQSVYEVDNSTMHFEQLHKLFVHEAKLVEENMTRQYIVQQPVVFVKSLINNKLHEDANLHMQVVEFFITLYQLTDDVGDQTYERLFELCYNISTRGEWNTLSKVFGTDDVQSFTIGVSPGCVRNTFTKIQKMTPVEKYPLFAAIFAEVGFVSLAQKLPGTATKEEALPKTVLDTKHSADHIKEVLKSLGGPWTNFVLGFNSLKRSFTGNGPKIEIRWLDLVHTLNQNSIIIRNYPKVKPQNVPVYVCKDTNRLASSRPLLIKNPPASEQSEEVELDRNLNAEEVLILTRNTKAQESFSIAKGAPVSFLIGKSMHIKVGDVDQFSDYYIIHRFTIHDTSAFRTSTQVTSSGLRDQANKYSLELSVIEAEKQQSNGRVQAIHQAGSIMKLPMAVPPAPGGGGEVVEEEVVEEEAVEEAGGGGGGGAGRGEAAVEGAGGRGRPTGRNEQTAEVNTTRQTRSEAAALKKRNHR